MTIIFNRTHGNISSWLEGRHTLRMEYRRNKSSMILTKFTGPEANKCLEVIQLTISLYAQKSCAVSQCPWIASFYSLLNAYYLVLFYTYAKKINIFCTKEKYIPRNLTWKFLMYNTMAIQVHSSTVHNFAREINYGIGLIEGISLK